jgi:hypothetical protein
MGASMKFFIAQAFLLIVAASSAFASQCTFEIIVQTDDRRSAGTDARVSLQLSSVDGQTLAISDLESWGLMGRGHNYFEKANADRFRGTGECMTTGPCKMLLTSDGTGDKPGWYVSYVQVAQVGQDVSVKQRNFAVNQWLAVDEAPHQLFAFRDGCGTAAVKP